MIEQKNRFGTIHGLRGIAALGVVIYHLSGNLNPELETLLPGLINITFSYGYLGVPIFFVISGFVISYSTKSTNVTTKYAKSFIVRRSIRLDLTYWASIFFAISLLLMKNKILNTSEEIPPATDILIHMFYLQDILNVDPVISVVYWTLCLEVQFYLFYIFSLWLSCRISYENHLLISLCIAIPLGIFSVFLDLGLAEININGLFISNWHYFLMGILVCLAIREVRYTKFIFFSWIFFEIAVQVFSDFKAYSIAGVLCSSGLFAIWKLRGLNHFFTGRTLTYFGTISYTLYLVHPDIGWKTISFGKKIIGDNLLPWHSGVLLLTGIATSIAIAHIFHLAFEKPSQKLATRIKSESLTSALKSYFFPNKSNRKSEDSPQPEQYTSSASCSDKPDILDNNRSNTSKK
ncbi:acyltransferase family protein [Marinobacter sp. F4206]|uniref:acyltransferase family protein n=1 Tax=Marinobacter sp. F4206 TaxID=2861777 RepID=UPI001C5F3D39|nr:acyltransferase [Marinobacter sp. F4206]MBW4933404.1 acyltransferase [Marinobacter sp. F4206]